MATALAAMTNASTSAAPTSADDWLPVGKVVAVQGLKGELRINPASEFPERFTEPGTRWLKARGKAPREIELKSGRQLPGKSVFVVRFAGVDSRDAAEALVGQTLMVPADDRPELEEGEFHLLDLVGLEARLSAEGEAIGSVSDLISGGNELLEIKTPDGRTLMVPFVEAIVPEVHLNDGWLLVTPPPGLLELG
ncbi:16S rRNA processing protein RimM [Synechococcus sp. NOUM97013]|nr:16S rRNA processing protein RimM [Synechococcus sp. NOUM97013]